ncbi:MAG TPA: GNAT family N-acetyltransferase [Ruminococcaceae bacterium]|nr:GNAT family N-acetyltransferase [Oscillospiraceae bacterium]
MKYIRHAESKDISRLAEILIFTKRITYRPIFQDDKVSFGKMQVLTLAKELTENKSLLDTYWVYDDEFVKGLIRIEKDQVVELYVDIFFKNQGIGKALLKFAVQKKGANHLWVLEKNTDAIFFYSHNGFILSDERKIEEGTSEYIVKMII